MDRRTFLGAAAAASLTSICPAGGPSAHANSARQTSRKLLQAFLDTLTAHDLVAFRALYVDSAYVQHQALVTNVPLQATGPDAAVAYFKTRIEAFPDLQVTSNASLFEGDMIAARFPLLGTTQFPRLKTT